MGRNLFLWFLLAYLTQIEFSIGESFLRAFLKNKIDVQYQQTFYPYSNADCVCSRNRGKSFLQCEGKFLVNVSTEEFLYEHEKMDITCNKTITSEDLNPDYQNLIGLNRSLRYILYLEDCPEPRISFVRQLFPLQKEKIRITTEKNTINNNREMVNNIETLDIQCVHRENFTITKKHLESLTKLENFRVSCFALKSLPWDLFQGTTPNLVFISISKTRIDTLPSRLFHNLTKLRFVSLVNNFIKKIKDEAFLGCRDMFYINMEGNQLSHLEENILDTLENITILQLTRNIFTAMPKIFKKISHLKRLDLSQNLLEQMNEEHCDGLFNIQYLNVSYNGITHIHPNCLTRNLVTLDISGNSLQNVTENPIELNKLQEFYFMNNSILHLDIKQFFTSRQLYEFHMSNSNVISLGNDTLKGFPSLRVVDFSNNNLVSVPEELFVKNLEMGRIYLQRNMISLLPSGLFGKNKKLHHIDLSWNRISVLPNHLFPQNCQLEELVLSFNRIENIPERFLSNITSLRVLKLSNNNVTSLGNDFLMEMWDLDYLDLSYNSLLFIESDMFRPLNISLNLRRLYLQGNNISSLPQLRLEKLEYLDLSMNKLSLLSQNVSHSLPNLKELCISKNVIALPLYYILSEFYFIQNLETLDLSNNKLVDFPRFRKFKELTSYTKLTSIDLSNNQFKSFDVYWIEFAFNLEKLNLSSNNINIFSDQFLDDPPPMFEPWPTINMTRLKVLDVSNNHLDLNYSPVQFEKRTLTWGRVSPFHIFPNLEVLLLRNNSITSICLDWRIYLPKLKFLDLRNNKLHFLTHQDLIFKSTSFYEIEGFGQYPCSHKLTVDLRHNKIRFVELPQRMLAILEKKNETKGAYGHATIVIEDNPFECGCALFNLLRVFKYDVVLTTQLKRVKGHDWVLPAKLDIGSLTCSTPETVLGKKLNNTEEWLHHLIPLFGLCTLQEIF